MRTLRPTALVLALAACWAAPGAANPLDPRLVAGQAAFAQQGKLLTVTSGERTIIDWRAFSIAADETTRFAQAGANAAVLNRVTGGATSELLGQLQSNGRVYLINPNGILIGNGARIDTAGFIASSLALSDADFLSGRLRFTDGDKAGAVINHGAIQGNGALVALVGAQVENHGSIESAGGQVVAAAARSVELLDAYSPEIRVVLEAASDAQLHRVLNTGAISVAVTAADDRAGEAVGARVEGGRIVLHAAGDTLLEGAATVSAANAAGKGGSVQVLGARVGLFDSAKVSAGGTAGGGEILIGGDYRGSNPAVRNADFTYVGASATLDASATLAGDGGRVIVWAEDTARVFGAIAARGAGGTSGGTGGFIETSGKRFLEVAGIRVDASGATPGTWLLDPLDITVVAGAGAVNNGGAPAFTPGGGSSQVGADLIVAQLNAGTGVTLNTGVAGPDAGNITIDAPIVKTANNAASLTLNATNAIAVNQNVTLSGTTTGTDAQFNAVAGGDFSVNNATVGAFDISIQAATISRSGTQTNDFVYGFVFPNDGSLSLTTTAGAVGSLANPIRFANPDFAGRTWSVNTIAAGAAGHVFLQPTAADVGTFGGTAFRTDPATTQTVRINHTGTGTFALYDDITGNDDWTLISAGSFSSRNFGGGGNGGTLTATSITATVAGDFGGTSASPGNPGVVFDTSAANGNITMTGGTFHGTGCGGDNFGFGVKPGTGIVSATSTGGHPSCGGSIQLAHFGGDLTTSKYMLDFTGGGSDNYMRLKAGDGHLIVDGTSGFSASLNDKNVELHTLTAGKDVIFAGGTVSGLRMNVYSAGNIDNLAPGVTGFAEICPGGPCEWRMHAAGGIGVTNPIDARADWVGSLQSGGVGDAGNIRVNFTTGAGWMPRLSNLATHAGSAQTINLTAVGNFSFNSSAPGFGGAVSAPGDTLVVNVSGDLHFQNAGTPTVGTFSAFAGNSMLRSGGFTADWVSASAAVTLTAGAGSIGTAGDYATFPGAATIAASAAQNIYIDAGANPLTLTGITTGAAAGTIGLRTTAANDLTLGGTTNINDALVLDIGGNILFPAAASFTTSGGLTLNSPTQIAATASVAITGGSFGGSGTLNNAGTLTKAGAGSGTLTALMTNSGTMNIDGGSLSLAGGYADGGGVLALGGGTLTAPAGGLTLATGTLRGVGTVAGDVANGGTVAPGASPGALTITGNYTQTAGGSLAMELGGTTQGVSYDLLQVGGTATLDGALGVAYVAPYVAAGGDVYDIITYAARAGDFATLTLPDAAMTANAGATVYQLTQPAAAAASPTLTSSVLRVAAIDLFDALAKVIPKAQANPPGTNADTNGDTGERDDGNVLVCK